MPCTECPVRYVDEMFLVEQQDDGLYHLNCSSGHRTTVWLQNPQFELLFDSGGLALLDGHSREAVSSIAAALERFMEFYVRIVALKHLAGQEPFEETIRRFSANQHEPFEETWKRVSKQSERQIGAFLFIYLLENGKPPPFIDEYKMQSYGKKENKHFRNAVIHEGYTPSQDQVIEYEEQIFQFICPILTELRTTSDEIIQKFTMGTAYKVYLQLQRSPTATQVIPTMISTGRQSPDGSPSFKSGLEQLKEVRTRVYS
ncbi:MAG TPA: hypothetical protein VGX03_13630 [Candidatus Binatia bacterium]|nr:hypothetical protein [Candidatus Binatia bacterium]